MSPRLSALQASLHSSQRELQRGRGETGGERRVKGRTKNRGDGRRGGRGRGKRDTALGRACESEAERKDTQRALPRKNEQKRDSDIQGEKERGRVKKVRRDHSLSLNFISSKLSHPLEMISDSVNSYFPPQGVRIHTEG